MSGKLTFHLGDDRLDTLRAVSSSTGVPVSELIRQGVDLFLACRVSGQVCSGALPPGSSVTVSVSSRCQG